MRIGMQLYTLRDYCKTTEDFAETLKKVADIGYKFVQVSGTCAYEAEWLKEQLDKNGLACPLTHYDQEKMINTPEATVSFHNVFGCKHIGLGGVHGFFGDLTAFDPFLPRFVQAAKEIHDLGSMVMYHNHHMEFNRRPDGRNYLELLADSIPADRLGFTLDTYWVQMGGGNPTEWLNRLSGRVPCIHLKDLRMCGTEQRMASVGSGNLNFDSIIAAAEKAGTEYAFVEQDETYGVDPFEEAASSFRYLSAMGLN